MTTDIPKPGPVTPIRAVPVRTDTPGLNAEDPERRRRIVRDLLPYFRDAEELLEVASWIETGDEEAT